ncbi:family 16 glycosylhydrolase [Microbispora sp. ATCC PTA-5024]|uniref:family 16 glycosylhydrolase n=1 Tax=Microbispora sp. ATCC PTA-5024 TaxID=316330 RepID=UPI0018DCEF71
MNARCRAARGRRRAGTDPGGVRHRAVRPPTRPSTPPACNGGGIGSPYTIGGDFKDGFHTYAVDWDQSHMTFYVTAPRSSP